MNSSKLSNKYGINQNIIEKLSGPSISVLDVRQYINSVKDKLNQVNTITLIHKASKRRVNPFSIIDIDVVEAILDPRKEILSAQGISSALYSLQSIPRESSSFNRFTTLLTRHIRQNQEPFPIQAISSSIYGLQHCGASEEFIIRPIIDSIATKLSDCVKTISPSNISSQSIGTICYGLNGISSKTSLSVHSILSDVATLIDASPTALDSQAIANIMFGINSLSSYPVAIDRLITSLCDHLEVHRFQALDECNIKAFSMLICGMQCLSSSYESMQRLATIISDAIERKHHNHTAETNPWMIRSAINLSPLIAGLKALSSDNAIIRRFIRNIDSLIDLDPHVWQTSAWDEQNIANSYYGLQSLSSYHTETLHLLGKLTNIFTIANITLSNRAITASLYGLQSMKADNNAVRSALKYLLTQLNNNLRKGSSYFTAQDIAYACHGMQLLSPSQGSVVTALVHAIASAIETTLHPINARASQSIHTHASHSSNARASHPSNARASHLIDARSYAMAMYGLKSMSSNSSAMIRLTCALFNAWDRHDTSMTMRDVLMIMQGMCGMGSEHIIVLIIFQRLTQHIRNTDEDILAYQYAIIFNSLQSMGGLRPAGHKTSSSSTMLGYGIIDPNALPRKLVEFIEVLCMRYKSQPARMSASMVASSLYGFQGITCDTPVVRELMTLFADDLRRSDEMMSSQSIGNSFYGLQNMSSRSEEVLGLVDALASAVNRSSQMLSSQAIGNSFYGLQHMSSDHPQVRRAVETLACKVDATINSDESIKSNPARVYTRYNVTLSGQQIGNALWGLRNMTADHPEVRHALRSLAKKIRQSPAVMNGQDIGNVLHGIHAMNDAYEEVRELLSALAYKIVSSDAKLSSLDVGMALYGVSATDHSSAEVRVILGTLMHKLCSNDDPSFGLKDLSLAIMGILKSAPWIREDFIRVLASKPPGMSTTNNTVMK